MTVLIAIGVLTLGAFLFGCLLSFINKKFKVEGDPLTEQIDSLLPQTQCGQCTYPGCKPYAEAIANGEADINQCPPGGQETIDKIADLMGVETKTLNAENGEEAPPTVVYIDEDVCIGCTLCIQACPVDAIVGAAKQMHTVIESECTGCDLCIPPCPVDCIYIKPVATTLKNWKWDKPNLRDNKQIPIKVVH